MFDTLWTMCENHVEGQRPVTGESLLENGTRVELASPGARLLARLADTFFVFFLAAVVLIVIHSLRVGHFEESEIVELGGLEGAVIGAVWLLYEIAGYRRCGSGSSLGKRLLRIRAVNARDGSAVSLWAALNRWSILAGGLIVLVIASGSNPPLTYVAFSAVSAVSILWSPTRQGWHDMAAGSVVIQVPTWTFATLWERFRESRREDLELLRGIRRRIKSAFPSRR